MKVLAFSIISLNLMILLSLVTVDSYMYEMEGNCDDCRLLRDWFGR